MSELRASAVDHCDNPTSTIVDLGLDNRETFELEPAEQPPGPDTLNEDMDMAADNSGIRANVAALSLLYRLTVPIGVAKRSAENPEVQEKTNRVAVAIYALICTMHLVCFGNYVLSFDAKTVIKDDRFRVAYAVATVIIFAMSNGFCFKFGSVINGDGFTKLLTTRLSEDELSTLRNRRKIVFYGLRMPFSWGAILTAAWYWKISVPWHLVVHVLVWLSISVVFPVTFAVIAFYAATPVLLGARVDACTAMAKALPRNTLDFSGLMEQIEACYDEEGPVQQMLARDFKLALWPTTAAVLYGFGHLYLVLAGHIGSQFGRFLFIVLGISSLLISIMMIAPPVAFTTKSTALINAINQRRPAALKAETNTNHAMRIGPIDQISAILDFLRDQNGGLGPGHIVFGYLVTPAAITRAVIGAITSGVMTFVVSLE
jgi:hypothetical protein